VGLVVIHIRGAEDFRQKSSIGGQGGLSDWMSKKFSILKGGRFSPKIQHFLRGELSDRMSKKSTIV
jgi:hypothetical protein